MAERIDIPISVTTTNMGGLDALQRRIRDLLSQVGLLRRDLSTVTGQAQGQPPPRPLPGQPPVTPPSGPRGVPFGMARDAQGNLFVPRGGFAGAGGGGAPAGGMPPAPRPGSPEWYRARYGWGEGWVPGQRQPDTPPPQPPPPPPGAPPPGLGQMLGRAGAGQLLRGLGPVGNIAGSALTGFAFGGGPGAAVFAGIATLQEGMKLVTSASDAWQQRARGVLQVGQLLDQNFAAITRSVVGLNRGLDASDKGLDILSQQALETIEAMSRATGRMPDYPTLRQAAGFGVAYGIAPAHAGALAGTLSMLGVGANPLARVAAGARNAFGTGGLPMRMDVLQEEAARIAGIGGTVAAPMDQEYYGRIAGMIGGMGTRYQLPGAASGFAERFAQGAANAPDDLTFMLRHRALDQLMRQRRQQGLGTTITIGTGANAETVDLASWQGRRIAMELAGQSPEILEQYRRTGQQEAGGNPELGGIMFENMVGGGRLGPTEARRLQRRVEAGGGFPRILTGPGRATAETEQAEVDAREGRRRGAQESLPGRVDAATQAMMERLGGDFAPKFLEAQLKLVEVGGKVEQIVREQFGKLSQAIDNHFPNLATDLGKAAEAMTTLSTRMEQAVQAAREQGYGPLAAPFAGLLPLWGAVQEGLSSTQRPAPAGPNTGAELGWPVVQPQRARGR